MSVKIVIKFSDSLLRNLTINRAINNAALFIRDFWLARSPYNSGDYARGLLHAGSIQVGNGKIVIENKSKYADYLEYGTRSFNIGQKLLANGKGVKISKDGHRYKRIKIEPNLRTRMRAESVQAQVVRSFDRLTPLGMNQSKVTKYGGIKNYETRRSLLRPIKGKAPLKTAFKGIFTISDKTCPPKWQVPAKGGQFLAREVQQEAGPIAVAAIQAAVQAEKERQKRTKGSSFKAMIFRQTFSKKISVIPFFSNKK